MTKPKAEVEAQFKTERAGMTPREICEVSVKSLISEWREEFMQRVRDKCVLELGSFVPHLHPIAFRRIKLREGGSGTTMMSMPFGHGYSLHFDLTIHFDDPDSTRFPHPEINKCEGMEPVVEEASTIISRYWGECGQRESKIHFRWNPNPGNPPEQATFDQLVEHYYSERKRM